ncbi:hypothetical protein EJ02DRAFT_510489 [Clathrospora elynae]|uniref:Restriction of telomere capping protein 4 n=1 Tax=Clathrospora elynae TaxID=706981 RepID=A0A6A5SUF4_9PLEO|nr:hypothetical protein EJ02DRAFT_510489 [Clathrospora elynae]
MSGLTKRNARPLLKTVGGKRHAEDDDHEGPAPKGRMDDNGGAPGNIALEKEVEEESINAEPLSSDEEMQVPSPQLPKPSKTIIPTPSRTENTELRKPPLRKSGRKGAPRPPARGQYQNGQADKAKRGFDDDKENLTSTQSSVGSTEDRGFKFDDMAFSKPSTKRQKTTFTSKIRSANIHTLPAKTKKKGSEFSKSMSQPKGQIRDKQGMDSDSDFSLLSGAEFDELEKEYAALKKVEGPEMRTKEVKPKRNRNEDGSPKPALLEDDELFDILGASSKIPKPKPSKSAANPTLLDDDELSDILGSSSKSPGPKPSNRAPKPTRFLDQISAWKEGQAPLSLQPGSSAPREDLENINDYIRQLPQEEEEGTQCNICQGPVDQDDYWAFWEGKDKTVKNKTAFCSGHKKKSAQEEYAKEGYPLIDWTALPERIRKHRMALYQILNNLSPSVYRDRYEPLALTGLAAAAPQRRKDLSEDLLEELNSHTLDDKAMFPGYYGPHGRRVLTEIIMDLLKTEIKKCKDRVVQGSGAAAFVQAVLVPEAAILLIIEDCTVDREGAEKIREETFEMGRLLNEEVEDTVDLMEDSDDENEYHHRY